MKKHVLSLLAGAAALALATSAATAADLPAPTAPPPPIVVPVFTWTGFYVGVNAGWGWRDNNNETVYLSPGPGTPGLIGTLSTSGSDDGGFTGGGQIGYNYQMGSFVLGAEADIQWADSGNKNSAVVFLPTTGFSGTFVPGAFASDAPDWYGTLRARVGFAIDRVLVYGTGGLAYTDNNTGWVLGGGLEWALPTNWNMFGTSAVTFGIEGLWFNVDRDDNSNLAVGTFTPIGLAPVAVFAPRTSNNDDEFAVVRAKLNFKFGTY